MNTVRLVAMATLNLVASGYAAASTYTTFDSFSTAAAAVTAAPVQLESFATIPVGTVISPGDTIDGITYGFQLTGGVTQGLISGAGNSFSGHSLGKNADSAYVPGDVVSFSFASPVNAAGVYLNTTAGKLYRLTSNGSFSETATTTTATPYDTGTFDFLGIVSSKPFTTVTVSGGFNADGTPGAQWGFPRIVSVAAVPEPSSYLLMTCSLLVLAVVARRRHPAQA